MSGNLSYYRYPLLVGLVIRLVGCVFIIVGLCMLTVGLLGITASMVAWLSGTSVPDRILSVSSQSLIFCVLSLGVLNMGIISLHQLPNIGIGDKGIYVQLFLVKWAFVPWENVLDLRLAPLSVFAGRQQVYVLQVKKLPLWFNLFSLAYLTGRSAGIPISWQIQGFDKLLQRLEDHLRQRDELQQGGEVN